MEIWKSEHYYDGFYQVSNLGRVRSLKFIKQSIMKGGFTSNGYPCVTFLVNKKQSTKNIHRLVAQLFVENPNGYKCVNHKNGIKSDNRAVNLEWCTHKQNSEHAVNTGLIKSGENSNECKTKEETIRMIFTLRESGVPRKEILEKLNVSIHIYKDVIQRRSWKQLILE